MAPSLIRDITGYSAREDVRADELAHTVGEAPSHAFEQYFSDDDRQTFELDLATDDFWA
jgi:hypothetical protein